MASQKWTDRRFGERVKAERERRGWSQPKWQRCCRTREYAPCTRRRWPRSRPETGRCGSMRRWGSPTCSRSRLTPCWAASRGHNAMSWRTCYAHCGTQSSRQVGAILETIREQLEELPGEFDGADQLQRIGCNTLERAGPGVRGADEAAIASDHSCGVSKAGRSCRRRP